VVAAEAQWASLNEGHDAGKEKVGMRISKIWVLVIPVIVLACMLIPAAALADGVGPGFGGSGADPTFNEGIAYDLIALGVGPVGAGDVVICEASAPSCSLSTPTQWSDKTCRTPCIAGYVCLQHCLNYADCSIVISLG